MLRKEKKTLIVVHQHIKKKTFKWGDLTNPSLHSRLEKYAAIANSPLSSIVTL